MKEILIRPATLEDLDTLLTFEQGVITAEKPLDPFLKDEPITYYNIAELITSATAELLVASYNNALIGSGYVKIANSQSYHKNPKHGYIGFIYVAPEYRGHKISAQIIAGLKNWANANGLKELRLDVYQNNTNALRAYERLGFSKSLINMRLEI